MKPGVRIARFAEIVVVAGSRRKAREWLAERGIDADAPALNLVTFPEDLMGRAGKALDLTDVIVASGPLRRELARRRDRFAWLSEAEFLAEMRPPIDGAESVL